MPIVPTASPTNRRSTHHLVLTQGESKVGLMFCDANGEPLRQRMFRKYLISGNSLQIHEGEAEHSDLMLPWRTTQQVDWSSGLGAKWFDKDNAAFEYGYGFDSTQEGHLIAGPMLNYGTGNRIYDKYWPTEADRFNAPTTGTTPSYARSFVAGATVTMDKAIFIARKVGSPTGDITVEVCADTAGVPGAVAGSATFAVTSLNKYMWYAIVRGLAASLTAGTTYWFVVHYNAGDASNYVEFLTSNAASAGKTWNGANWIASTYGVFFRLYASWFPSQSWLFEYKGGLYAIKVAEDLSIATKLYKNGDVGVATGGAVTYLDDSTKAWTNDEWIGATIVLTRGTGSNQAKYYATITDNTATRLTFQAVGVAPAAGTEYAILASEKWTEITGHGLAQKYVTDVLVANGAIYVCQGSDANVRLMRFYVNAGAWTAEYADEGYKAQFLMPYSNASGSYIAAALPGVPGQVKSAAPVDHTANATSTTALGIAAASAETVGDLYERITGLEVFAGNLWALKEHSMHYKDLNGDWIEADIREMQNAKDPRNGAAHLVSDVYLWSSYLNGVLRYSEANSVIDGMGYEKTSEGFKRYGGGEYKHLTQAHSKIFACVGGEYTDGKLMVFNKKGRDGIGWCNWLRGGDWQQTSSGDSARIEFEKINRAYVQSIPGDAADRLWLSIGGDICWMSIAANPWGFQAVSPSDPYIFGAINYVETSWITAKYHDVNKSWESFILEVEHYLTAGYTFEFMIEYDIDDGNGWQTLATKVSTIGRTELTLSSTHNVSSKKIRFRVHLLNMDYNFSPRITYMGVKSLMRIPVEWGVSGYVRIADNDFDLVGKIDPQDADAKLAIFDTFLSTAAPVVATSISRRLHNHYYVIDPNELYPIENSPVDNHTGESNKESNVYGLRMYEIA